MGWCAHGREHSVYIQAGDAHGPLPDFWLLSDDCGICSSFVNAVLITHSRYKLAFEFSVVLVLMAGSSEHFFPPTSEFVEFSIRDLWADNFTKFLAFINTSLSGMWTGGTLGFRKTQIQKAAHAAPWIPKSENIVHRDQNISIVGWWKEDGVCYVNQTKWKISDRIACKFIVGSLMC